MTDELDRVVDLTLSACAAYGRPDLVDRLEQSRHRSDAPPYVLVVGEYQQGKSSLVNAMTVLGTCPASAVGSTAVPTVVHLGGEAGAVMVHLDGTLEPCDPAALASVVLDTTALSESLDRVEVRLGADQDVLVVVDGPGAGGWSSRLGARSLGWLPLCLGTVVCHDGGSPLTEGELALVEMAASLCPGVAVAVTRIDLHPSWREVVGDVRDRLDAAGLGHVSVLPVSARLWADPDQVAQKRSGIEALLRWSLEATAPGDGAARLRGTTRAAISELEAGFSAERAELEDAGTGGAEPQAKDNGTRGWQTVLADGVGDLGAEVDAAWRSSTKDLLREADERLDSIDPAIGWDPFESWLRSAGMAAGTAAFALLRTGLDRVSSDVLTTIGDDGQFVLEADGDARDRLGDLRLELRLDAAAGLGSRTMVALRSSYSGMALAGMLAGAAGLPLAGPALLVFGAVMAGKGTRDDRRKQRDQRRQQARQAARRYLDDLSQVVNQSLRDGLRLGQRELRDAAFARAEAIAQERKRWADEARRGEAARQRRLDDIAAELARVAKLRARLEQLAAGTTR